MNTDFYVFGPVVLPLFGSALAFLAKALPKKGTSRLLEYTGAFFGFALPWLLFVFSAQDMLDGIVYKGIIGGWHAGTGIAYKVDGLSWLVNLLGFSVAGAAWIYSLGAGPKGPAFTAVFLIQTAALAATIMTADLFNLFVCLELLGIASYVLVASSGKPGSALASFSYLMVSATAMVFFLVGLFGFYRLTGSLSYEGIADGLAVLPDNGGIAALLSLALVISAVAIRVAVMPLYGWLPDAHALAPHAVSAVLSGVLIKTPLFALSRVLHIMPAGSRAGLLLSYTGALTALVAVCIALSQKDAKRLLAYHSISQIGYIVSAWGAAIHTGIATHAGIILFGAAFLHAFYHALFKGLLFLSTGTSIDAAVERDVMKLRGMARILRESGEKTPVTMIAFFIGACAISAVPPFNGYISKTVLSFTLKDTLQYYLLFAAGIGTAASFMKLSRIFLPDKSYEKNIDFRPAARRIPVCISQSLLALMCAGFGISGGSIFRFVLRILSPGNNLYIPPLYTFETILKTSVMLLSGFFLFKAATSRRSAEILRRIRERPRDFQGLFVSFSLGTALLAVWLVFF